MKSGSKRSMWAPNSSPYWKSNSVWPLFSTGIASFMPAALIRSWIRFGAPNCSSTRPPAVAACAPFESASSRPSKISSLPSAIRRVSSSVGSPSIPNHLLLERAPVVEGEDEEALLPVPSRSPWQVIDQSASS